MRSQPLVLTITAIALLCSGAGIVHLWLTVGERAGTAIQIPNVHFEGTHTTIYVQNLGRPTVTLDSVYLNQERFAINLTNCVIASEPATTLAEGQTAEIIVPLTFQETVHVRVICTDGTFIEADWTP